MICPEHRWIFVHIQKTGGDSYRTALGVETNDLHKHRTAVELRAVYGGDAWEDYYSCIRAESLGPAGVMVDHDRCASSAISRRAKPSIPFKATSSIAPRRSSSSSSIAATRLPTRMAASTSFAIRSIISAKRVVTSSSILLGASNVCRKIWIK